MAARNGGRNVIHVLYRTQPIAQRLRHNVHDQYPLFHGFKWKIRFIFPPLLVSFSPPQTTVR